MKAIAGGIIFLVFFIILVLHSVNTYYNIQDIQYFDQKAKEAQQKVDRLEALGYGSSDMVLSIFAGSDY